MTPVVFTRDGLIRGARDVLPLLLGVTPFGLVTGIASQGADLSLGEAVFMSVFVYAGASQLVALAIWAHPPPLLAVTLAAFVVNLRLALMGPVLSPWFDRFRGWRVWFSMFVMTDQNWAMSVREMNRGGRDAAYLLGSGLPMWLVWTITTAVGHYAGSALRPPPGHPVFFAALAVFVSMLAGMWRGRRDVLPYGPWLSLASILCLLVGRAGLHWYLPGFF